MKKGQNVITTTCAYDCGGRCLLKVHIKDGNISRISTEKRGGLHIQACPRGLAQDAVLKDPGRLKQPMKRIGARGVGKFEPIQWDEALQIITEQIQRVSNRFGTESITFITGTGSLSTLHNTSKPAQRFFGLLGRCVTNWGVASCEGAIQSSLATFGTPLTGNTRDNLKSSKLIIFWGWNPLITRFGPDSVPNILQAKEAGVKIICVDPRLSASCRSLADEWIPIKPGTDTSLLIAMAYVVITEGLYDEDFVENYTFGFDSFCDYLTGKEDGQVKSPKWAQSICGVSAERIKTLSRSLSDNT